MACVGSRGRLGREAGGGWDERTRDRVATGLRLSKAQSRRGRGPPNWDIWVFRAHTYLQLAVPRCPLKMVMEGSLSY